MPRVTVVIPTKNESKTLPTIVRDLRAELARLGLEEGEIIVTDDSKDDTRRLARSLGCRVVIGDGKGLGYAMWKGLKAALESKPDVILSIDGDGQTQLGEMKAFVDPILADEADLVLGSRFLRSDLIHYKYRLKNRIGIFILVRILRYFTKLPLTDSHGGFRGIRPDVVKALEMIGTHTYVQETIIDAYEKGFRIKEVASAWHPRQEGKSRVVSSIPLYIFYTLPVLILRSGHHIKFLYPLGIFFIFLSGLDFLITFHASGYDFFQLIRWQSFHMILMLLTIGISLFFFGFTLELVNRIKLRLDRVEV